MRNESNKKQTGDHDGSKISGYILLILSLVSQSGCITNYQAAAALSGGNTKSGKFSEDGRKLYISYLAMSDTRMPSVNSYTKDFGASASIDLDELFDSTQTRHLRKCGESKCLPGKSSPIPGTNWLPPAIAEDHSKCYRYEEVRGGVEVIDICSANRKAKLMWDELHVPTPLWAYPAKVVAYPVTFAIDLVLWPFVATGLVVLALFGGLRPG